MKMKYCFFVFLMFYSLFDVRGQECLLKLTQETLMHEVRKNPCPLNGQHLTMNPPRFMWPDKFPYLGEVLDGVDEKCNKPLVTYRIRISQDSTFRTNVIRSERRWAFFNPFRIFENGKWYWQYAYVNKDGIEEWSPIYHFYVDEKSHKFNPPSLEEVKSKFSSQHPRILLDREDWQDIICRNKENPEANSYIAKARKCLGLPLKHLSEEIDTTHLINLGDMAKYRSALIRESRKIVDREESNIETIIRAYLLTKNEVYYKECMKRLIEVLSWRHNPYFAGDFNSSTVLSLCTSAYDAFYDLLTPEERKLLLSCIQEVGNNFFKRYVNHLENRIADNHSWQMTFRIFTMCAFAVLNELPEASVWVDYCYNLWVSRFPGLNNDGGWHNGDSYFHVNIRTLIEVPAFYSRITGFNFFNDPWYNNNALYVIYSQPPFSKSAGMGNSHESKKKPNGARVGYADALARECQNPWAAAYVKMIMKKDPNVLLRSFGQKSGDLTWYRCVTKKTYPQDKRRLSELPSVKVFPETGLAIMHTSIGEPEKNSMLSFRSSPYGSTSHAHANQNAFNTFYGGEEIFYSSGYHTNFIDEHSMYSYRHTRAHNTILVDGMGQKIGTEGYGWIPRFYEGEKISYVVGDASNAYGNVTSPLWLKRAELSNIHFTPEKGWDKNKLKMFRRHIIQLDNSGIYLIYDELESTEPVNWSYLLHTTELPMEIEEIYGGVKITGKNKSGGVSVAHLFCSEKITHTLTDTFFCDPIDWKNRNIEYSNHWHFSGITPKCLSVRFLTIMDIHGHDRADAIISHKGNTFYVQEWTIQCNLTNKGKSEISVVNNLNGVSLLYDASKNDGASVVNDEVGGQIIKEVLCDYLPDFEI